MIIIAQLLLKRETQNYDFFCVLVFCGGELKFFSHATADVRCDYACMMGLAEGLFCVVCFCLVSKHVFHTTAQLILTTDDTHSIFVVPFSLLTTTRNHVSRLTVKKKNDGQTKPKT